MKATALRAHAGGLVVVAYFTTALLTRELLILLPLSLVAPVVAGWTRGSAAGATFGALSALANLALDAALPGQFVGWPVFAVGSSLGVALGGASGVVGDLARRQAAYAALLQRTMPCVLWARRTDARGRDRAAFVSPNVEEMTGVPAAAFIADFPAALRRFAGAEAAEEAFQRAVQARARCASEFLGTHAVTGAARWMRIDAAPSPQPDGSTLWSGALLDIDASKRRELELEAARSALAEAAETSRVCQEAAAVGTWAIDAVTRRVTWSEGMHSLHGSRPGAAPPTLGDALQGYRPPDRARLRAGIEGALAGDAAQEPGEYRLAHPDGAERVHRIWWARCHDASGRLARVVGANLDVTTARNLAALSASVAEATAANRAKTLFLAHMSHELRTPLNAILGLSEALLEKVYGPLTPKQDRSLATIHTSGQHLLALVNDLLDLSRVEAGKLELERHDFALGPLLEECVAVVAESARRREQSVHLAVDRARSLHLHADRRRMKQVLLNLLGNATKFSGDGGQIRVEPHVDAATGEVGFCVADSGPGIPPEDHGRIFAPFTTLDSTLSRAHEGSGLGLALVKGLVELHGGRVEVESTPGAGALFRVALPARDRAPGAAPPSSPSATHGPPPG